MKKYVTNGEMQEEKLFGAAQKNRRGMKKPAAVIAVVLSLSVIGLSGCASGTFPDTVKIQNAESEDIITVTGREEVKVTPDMAEIRYSVYSREDTADACQKKNGEDLEKAIETLKGLGVSEQSIQTSSYGLNPIQNWNSDRQEVIGYEMTTELVVSNIPISDVGLVLSKSVEAGVNGIDSVSYFSSDYDASYQEALKGAMEMAKAKALALADASGSELTGAARVEEFGYQPDVRYSSYNRMASKEIAVEAGATDEGMAVMPGQVSVEAQVIVDYKLAR